MIYDIAIVGAGTGGLTAAIYGRRSGKTVIVMESSAYGGKIVNASEIKNYPGLPGISGFDYAKGVYDQAKELGADIVFDVVQGVRIDSGGIKELIGNKDTVRAKTLIIATGASSKKLKIPREEELTGKGVSYCAYCDGMFYRKKNVAVIGGGDMALDDALYLSQMCAKVYLVHRRDEFTGSLETLRQLKEKENLEILTQSVVKELTGKDGVDGIVIQNTFTKEQKSLSVDGVFIAVGNSPSNDVFGELLDLDEKGYVITGEDMSTGRYEGIYAAGDCRQKTVRQLVTAASDGAIAALTAVSYLNRRD